ncbi:hypothetical protein [Hyperthermus butylicus]|uniref:Uncharacterized protein n=1 Tax=Hyperthermus butylicus (strain DSM 5456 / JCM 9403 / PLM1-5) TaxID=415426 RepID=A2BLM4_HYPBU|nr:hypothetical protein [Hyperthermus butylicus]ABM80885.1 hypothetical protein Hbut_1041 [Hyperthermus butylicus DSM 5456]
MEASIVSRSMSSFYGLPLDHVAAKVCCADTAGVEFEVEGDVWLRLERELSGSRFTGRVCIVYESGYQAGLVLVDGVVFGAYLEAPDGGVSMGEQAVTVVEALWGPATVRFWPASLEELEAAEQP